MKSSIKNHLFLIIFVFIITGLHLYKLGQIPSILNPDEASIAYNAFLLKQTGKDEWGKSWPLVLDAFGDQKLIGYPALVVAAFSLFGYSDWVVKLPSLIAGSFLIVLIYGLQLKLRHSKRQAMLSAFMIGVVPVFFFYSRVAFEAMAALVYLLIGLNILLTSKREVLKTRNLLDFLAILFFLAALLTYNSPLLLVPVITAAIIFERGLKNWKSWILFLSMSVVIWFGFAVYFLPLTQQKSKITLFGDETTLNQFGTYRDQFSGISKSLLGNKYVFYSGKIVTNYLNSWSPGFMMNNVGGHPWHTIQGFGYLYWSIYILGLVGIFAKIYFVAKAISIKSKEEKISIFQLLLAGRSTETREIAIILIFLFSLIPAVITVNAPQATRSLLFFFFWCYFAAFGLFFITAILTKALGRIVLVLAVLIIIAESMFYTGFYFGRYANDAQLQSMFQPGFDKVVQIVDKDQAQAVAIVDERGFDYVLLAWYLKMKPDYFFATTIKQQPDKINFKYGEQVGKYHFVAKSSDRRITEKEVIEWNPATYKWDILQY